ncbi:MAG: DUF885 domain-containing protein [Elusimicrobia bacterium]|nr:DUF885 domain-containing protein [Elusimicrobiota bacterium]
MFQLVSALSLAASAAPTLKSLELPGTPAFSAAAKDVIDVRFAIDPSLASAAGLFDDAVRVPSFDPEAVAGLTRRLRKDLESLRAMPWRSWEIDRQIDWRWVYVLAEDGLRQLETERLYLHRPASWLEPLANDYIFLLTFAPQRADLRAGLTKLVPGMVAELRRVATRPTLRAAATAVGVAEGVLATLRAEPASPARDAAVSALSSYIDELRALKDPTEYAVIGRENYAWRLRHANLLPWSPQQLLALATRELVDVETRLEALKPRLKAIDATEEARRTAEHLTQESLLALYDKITDEDRRFLDRADLVTVPPGVGPIRTRPTPEAMIPLTGDGGSMNPPVAVGGDSVGWWNVEHFKPEWDAEKRLSMVRNALERKRTDMGPYAVHEGLPGHHLQLSIARLHPNPLRKLLYDNSMVEGWALYAEEAYWAAGGFGTEAEAEREMLNSYLYRVRRVFYDAHVESGDWTLQEAADFKTRSRRGEGKPDEDVQRTINWPAQLIGYFAGKQQILALREEYRRKLGAAYSDRRFHDALLAEGSIPVALIRAKLLGEPVPGVD